MEDLDPPREVPGAAAGILATLETFGFEWDGEVLEQSSRGDAYSAALARLASAGLTFECSCSRSSLTQEDRYPGYCRAGPRDPTAPTATRLRIEPGVVRFTDRIQGDYQQDVAAAVGDVALKRRDGIVAYQLAVVVDDAFQGVTHVVRGADLLDNTPRQIYLQERLGLSSPVYAHVPALVESDGGKLGKSARSMRLEAAAAVRQLVFVFGLLGLEPPRGFASAREAWEWALARWDLTRVARRPTWPLEPPEGPKIAGKPPTRA
jgi:glutamyl-Q tRNA(Asp) synthetase